MLVAPNRPKEDLVVRGARVLDPGQGLDAVVDVRIDGGTIAELGADLPANGHRVVEAEGLVLAPAFVDPHVHLRTPGREDEEDSRSGTRAAAAGGYCAILAMPNTDPVVDSAAVLGALDRAARGPRREIPVGFLAAITKGQAGAELTEMVELAERGAAGFTDDGQPVMSPGLLRRALQYSAAAGPPIALHCEEETPHARRAHARGHDLRGARLRRLAVDRRERHGRPRPRARALRVAAAPPAAPLRARVGRRAAARAGRRGRRDRRGDAAPPLPHRRGGAQPRPEHEDEPAAARRGRPPGAARGAPRRDDLCRSRPTTLRTRGTRRRCRSRRRRSASPASRPRSRCSTRGSSRPASCRSRRCSSG